MIRRFIGVAVVALMFISCNEQKTAYVDTTKLIQEYKEMKDVEADFTTRSNSVRERLDSVARAFQDEYQAYEAGKGSMSASQRESKEQELMQKQQMLRQQQQMESNRLRQESQEMMDSLVTKVKDFVKGYGEENDYTYIFGSNESANIMYAEEGLDITEEVLKELNEEYSGGSSMDTETETEVETEIEEETPVKE